jgi:cytochrome b561
MKAIRNTPTVWSPVAKLFHWSTALLIGAMFVLGWLAVTYPMSPTKIELFNLHKSLGLFILAWTLLRLGWRITHEAPPLPVDIRRAERRAARLAHAALYVLIIAMPFSGWVINSAADFPLKWFGLFRIPQIVGPNEGLQDIAELVHFTLSWTILAVLALHIVAALRHHFVMKNEVLLRMLPFVKSEK